MLPRCWSGFAWERSWRNDEENRVAGLDVDLAGDAFDLAADGIRPEAHPGSPGHHIGRNLVVLGRVGGGPSEPEPGLIPPHEDVEVDVALVLDPQDRQSCDGFGARI